eukprot:10106308-Alexandrium_andersonii.AAC.1
MLTSPPQLSARESSSFERAIASQPFARRGSGFARAVVFRLSAHMGPGDERAMATQQFAACAPARSSPWPPAVRARAGDVFANGSQLSQREGSGVEQAVAPA